MKKMNSLSILVFFLIIGSSFNQVFMLNQIIISGEKNRDEINIVYEFKLDYNGTFIDILICVTQNNASEEVFTISIVLEDLTAERRYHIFNSIILEYNFTISERVYCNQLPDNNSVDHFPLNHIYCFGVSVMKISKGLIFWTYPFNLTETIETDSTEETISSTPDMFPIGIMFFGFGVVGAGLIGVGVIIGFKIAQKKNRTREKIG